MKINYKNREILSEENEEKNKVDYYVESASLDLQAAILSTKKSVQDTKAKLEELKSEYPLDIQKIVDTAGLIEQYEDGLRIAENLKKELGLWLTV